MLDRNIRNFRLQLGLSQRQLAGKEMTRAFISMVEAGRAAPSEKTLLIIAQRLGRTVEELRKGAASEGQAATGEALLTATRRMAEAGDHETALRLVRELLKLNLKNNLLVEGRLLLISCLQQLEMEDEAMSECEAVLDHLRAPRDRKDLVRIYLQLGALTFKADNFLAARRAYEQAITYSSEDRTLMAPHTNALTYLGTTMVRLGQLGDAISTYLQAYELYALQGETEDQGRVAMGLSKAFFQSNQLDESLIWARRATELLSKANGDNWVLALHNVAVIQATRGFYEEAFRLYETCLTQYEGQGRVDKQASILEDLAAYWLARGDLSRAKQCSHRALDLLEKVDNGVLRGRLYRVLGITLDREGDSERAYHFLRMSYDLLRRLKVSYEANVSQEALNTVRAKL